MNRPPLRTVLEGGAVAAIGASIVILVPSQTNPIPGLQTQMSPGLIPTLVGAGLILSGLGLILQSSLGSVDEPPIDLDRTASVRIVISVLLIVAYTMIFPLLGFVVTSAIFVGFFTWFFGAHNPVKIGLMVVLPAVVVWLFFEQLFRIPLPHGVLF